MTVWTKNELIAIRRKLHQIPEIGLEEFETHEYLMQKIHELPQEQIEVKEWKTAIVVKVKGTSPSKTIGWRTDIDGLPIKEETGLDFSSTHPGKMHACGHDMHMTVALGLLQEIVSQRPKNNFVFLFQPAEENESGGKLVYEYGLLDDCLPDEFYGLHVQPFLPVGTIGTRVGTLFAGTCEIQAHFTGKGGHAAFPHESNDMIIAATEFVQQAQTIVSRNVNPIEGAVVTFGTFEAGTTNNVIAGSAHVSGTIRTLTQSMNELTQKRIRQIAEGIAMSFQCELDMTLTQKGYLPVENNPETTKNFMTFMRHYETINLIETEPAMTGEDFGYLLSKIPGTMFWLGVDSPYGLHHEKMTPKEEAIEIGVQAISAFFAELDKK